jgi:hypothetical protein
VKSFSGGDPADGQIGRFAIETINPERGVIFQDPKGALFMTVDTIPTPDWRRVWILWHEPGAGRSHEEVARR